MNTRAGLITSRASGSERRTGWRGDSAGPCEGATGRPEDSPRPRGDWTGLCGGATGRRMGSTVGCGGSTGPGGTTCRVAVSLMTRFPRWTVPVIVCRPPLVAMQLGPVQEPSWLIEKLVWVVAAPSSWLAPERIDAWAGLSTSRARARFSGGLPAVGSEPLDAPAAAGSVRIVLRTMSAVRTSGSSRDRIPTLRPAVRRSGVSGWLEDEFFACCWPGASGVWGSGAFPDWDVTGFVLEFSSG